MQMYTYAMQPAPNQRLLQGFYQTTEFYNMPAPNLINDIHPMFAEERFATNVPRDRMIHVLRLCSRLIDSDAAMAWFWQLFKGEADPVTKKNRRGEDRVIGFQFREDLRDKILTNSEKAETRRLLLELSKIIHFRLQTSAGASETCVIRWTRSCSDEFPWYADVLMDLDETWLGRTPLTFDEDPVLYIWESFNLAATIMHELAHAAKSWHADDAVFWPGEMMGEEGYAMEAQLFGGILQQWPSAESGRIYSALNPRSRIPYYVHNRKQSNLKRMIVMTAWPNPKLLLEYEGVNAYFPVLDGYVDSRTTRWNVAFSYLVSMFQECHWMIHGSRVTGTRIPVARGIVVRVGRNPKTMEAEEVIQGEEPPHLLPPTHQYMGQGVMLPRGYPASQVFNQFPNEFQLIQYIANVPGGRIFTPLLAERVRPFVQGRWSEFSKVLNKVAVAENTEQGEFVRLILPKDLNGNTLPTGNARQPNP